jgi:hypothetical protein
VPVEWNGRTFGQLTLSEQLEAATQAFKEAARELETLKPDTTIKHTGGRYERLPATAHVVTKLSALYGGIEITRETEINLFLQLRDMHVAASFMSTNHEWSIRLRDPITVPSHPVTLIVTKDQECGRPDCWCEPGQYVEA